MPRSVPLARRTRRSLRRSQADGEESIREQDTRFVMRGQWRFFQLFLQKHIGPIARNPQRCPFHKFACCKKVCGVCLPHRISFLRRKIA